MKRCHGRARVWRLAREAEARKRCHGLAVRSHRIFASGMHKSVMDERARRAKQNGHPAASKDGKMSLNFTLQIEKDVTERSHELVYPGGQAVTPTSQKMFQKRP